MAFDLNRKAEVDFLTYCFKRYSRRPVRRVLDIACGTGPHLFRLARRGYRMIGLDLSRNNIAYVRARAADLDLPVSLHVADMMRFTLEAPGTGSPEPGGLSVPELVEIIRLLEGVEVIGTDLVEVAHAHDPSGRTGIAGSWVLREAILTWWGK